MMNPRIKLVVATRERYEDFPFKTALGKSLALYNYPFVEIELIEQNRLGLPTVYNIAIEAAKQDPAILVFIHDDVHLCSFDWHTQLLKALTQFQLVGLAGNKRRVKDQPAWAFIDTNFIWDAKENLSGIVGHGNGFPPQNLSQFGEPCQEVKLLDGLLLACHSNTFHEHDIRFDERFEFHFYDLDICRQFESKKLKMGTWSISTIHESGGNFGSEAWKASYERYINKWQS